MQIWTIAFLLFCLYGFKSAAPDTLPGVWVLEEIRAEGTIAVPKEKQGQYAVTDRVAYTSTGKEQMALRDYVARELTVGISKFIFTDTQFEFYGQKDISRKGTWQIKNNRLLLTDSQKNDTLSHIMHWPDAQKLELETDWEGNSVVLVFARQ